MSSVTWRYLSLVRSNPPASWHSKTGSSPPGRSSGQGTETEMTLDEHIDQVETRGRIDPAPAHQELVELLKELKGFREYEQSATCGYCGGDLEVVCTACGVKEKLNR